MDFYEAELRWQGFANNHHLRCSEIPTSFHPLCMAHCNLIILIQWQRPEFLKRQYQQYIYGSFYVAKSAAKSQFSRREARALSGMQILPYVHGRSIIASDAALLTPIKRYVQSQLRALCSHQNGKNQLWVNKDIYILSRAPPLYKYPTKLIPH